MRNGTFKSGIIYKGKFFKGKIESGEIRGGQFIDMEIDPKVIEYTGGEYQAKQQEEQQKLQQPSTAVAQPAPTPKTDVVKVHSTPPAAAQQQTAAPQIQQENNQYKMKKIKNFKQFNESVGEYEDSFIDINIDETDLEMSKSKTGKLKQKPGKIIIETPSKTDAYNMKMQYGGEEIADGEKQILTIKDTKR
jgi:hypothetical protein